METPTLKERLDSVTAELHSAGMLYHESVKAFERSLIWNALKEAKGNQSTAARKLGMHRNTLHRNMEQLAIAVRRTPGAPTRRPDAIVISLRSRADAPTPNAPAETLAVHNFGTRAAGGGL